MFSVIFDMDGTLLDTQRIYVSAWDYAGSKQGIDGLGERIPDVLGMPENDWTDYLIKNFPTLDIAKFKTETKDYIVENLEVKFKPGAKELLEFLKQSGIKMAIASGSSKKLVLHHLNAVNAVDYFDAIVGGDEVENGKPNPEIFIKAAKQIDAAPDTCFVIEDSENGVIAGHRAKMKCIGVPDIVPFSNKTQKLCYAYVNSLLDVLEIFKKLK